MEDLLSVAKELLEDFDLYGSPVQLDVIAKLRRAVEAAQQMREPDSLKAHVACPQCAWLFEINLPAWGGLRKPLGVAQSVVK